ncbi:MAG: folate-binding protein YgfZ [Sandaracinus sp.]|nr:folate-binding protein YgfZ [Sandaracinus sp.]
MDDRRLAFLLDERVLRVEGDDARTWLQGQITSDIHREAPGTSTYGLVLVGTGQVLADVWVLDLGDTFLVRSASAVFDELVARLDRYVVMEDVELEPTSLSVVHVVGDGLELGDGATVTDRVGRPGVDLLVEDASATLAELEAAGFERGDEATFEALRIAAARPRLGRDFGLNTLPQEAGLVGAVSFTKGCYFGQEPVVMLRDRGKPPKRLVHVVLEAEASPGIAVTREGAEVGTLTSVAGTEGLALVKRRALEAGDLRIAGVEPRAIRVIE